MDYQKLFNQHHINASHLDDISQQFALRAKELRLPRQADAIYQAAAADLAMGAIELHLDTQEGMKESISPAHWLEIITGCKPAA